MGDKEEGFVREAFATNWLSTIGPNIDAFEQELGARVGMHAVALGSGTAAVHLALRLLGVGPGDDVVCSTLTFVASINPAVYLGAKPVFIDSDRESWNMDPQLLRDFLRARAEKGKLPRAVIAVHLYGQCADLDPIMEACARYDVPLIEDAAEAAGATYKGKPAGSFGVANVFSFNGNKMITTTGGGMLVSARKDWIDKARFWSTQARDPAPHYQHSELGYNYRMSNVLAGIGRGQLLVLDERVKARRAVAFRYAEAFADLPGISLMPQASYGLHTNWLSVFYVDPRRFGATRDDILAAMTKDNIEARPVWKPMHVQPLFADAERVGGAVAEDLFANGVCLPSSSSLTDEEQARVIELVRAVHASARGSDRDAAARDERHAGKLAESARG
jgi:pyridoxal phosphate-dependent aminotransferase EpsN